MLLGTRLPRAPIFPLSEVMVASCSFLSKVSWIFFFISSLIFLYYWIYLISLFSSSISPRPWSMRSWYILRTFVKLKIQVRSTCNCTPKIPHSNNFRNYSLLMTLFGPNIPSRNSLSKMWSVTLMNLVGSLYGHSSSHVSSRFTDLTPVFFLYAFTSKSLLYSIWRICGYKLT